MVNVKFKWSTIYRVIRFALYDLGTAYILNYLFTLTSIHTYPGLLFIVYIVTILITITNILTSI